MLNKHYLKYIEEAVQSASELENVTDKKSVIVIDKRNDMPYCGVGFVDTELRCMVIVQTMKSAVKIPLPDFKVIVNKVYDSYRESNIQTFNELTKWINAQGCDNIVDISAYA